MSGLKSKTVGNNNNQTSTLISQPLSCPWSSRAPTSSSSWLKGNGGPSMTFKLDSTRLNRGIEISRPLIKMACNNSHQLNVHSYYPIPPSTCLPSQNSTTQFFHFFRLMQLFPEVHPATLHTVLFMCKNDFFCAVDKLLYIKRLRQVGNNKGKSLKTCQNNLRTVQHPYWNLTQPGDRIIQRDPPDVPKKPVQKVIFLPQPKSDQKNARNNNPSTIQDVKPFIQSLDIGTKSVENAEPDHNMSR
ncbi:uncharacterized protein LOC108741225 [Agrilus planipennis]|uniref:Uncharacterized protein LOC108741225 n=1 Tax=Agrilus planipennis TaxID=224129 RepID=A0A1W4X5R0_AGRPL|nr:uncharacterized protein LOC108741225 [Agrilus planipennis]